MKIYSVLALLGLFILSPSLRPQSLNRAIVHHTPEKNPAPHLVQRGMGTHLSTAEASTSQLRFECRQDNQVVIDRLTRLMWQRSGSPYMMIGDRAAMYVDSLNRAGFAGYNDWRLPTAAEALSLVEWRSPAGEALLINPVFDPGQPWIITATADAADWPVVVYFTRGSISSDPVAYFGTFVRLVRSIESPEFAQIEGTEPTR